MSAAGATGLRRATPLRRRDVSPPTRSRRLRGRASMRPVPVSESPCRGRVRMQPVLPSKFPLHDKMPLPPGGLDRARGGPGCGRGVRDTGDGERVRDREARPRRKPAASIRRADPLFDTRTCVPPPPRGSHLHPVGQVSWLGDPPRRHAFPPVSPAVAHCDASPPLQLRGSRGFTPLSLFTLFPRAPDRLERWGVHPLRGRVNRDDAGAWFAGSWAPPGRAREQEPAGDESQAAERRDRTEPA